MAAGVLTGPTTARAAGRLAVVLLVCSVALVVVDGLLGPSAVQPDLPSPGPRRSFLLLPASLPATGLLVAAVLVGAAGLLVAWWAQRLGWDPSPRRLLGGGLLGAAAVALVPSMGSSDILAYASYGRLAVLGLSPYSNDPLALVRLGDPVGLAYPGPWSDAESVYGPVATLVQWGAVRVGGTSVRVVELLLQLVALVAFAATALLLDRAARRWGVSRARTALVWAANPLLMLLLVNGAHLDVLAVAPLVAGLLLLGDAPALAGALAGVSAGVKVSYLLGAVALGWAVRRSRRALVAFTVSALAVLAVLTAPFLPEILGPLATASSRASVLSPWDSVDRVVRLLLPDATGHRAVALLSWALFAAVVWRLAGGVRRGRSTTDPGPEAARVAVVLGLAWTMTAAYSLAWYDAMVWAPLGLVAAGGTDLLLLARTTAMSLGSLPGYGLPEGDPVRVVNFALGRVVAPLVDVALVVVVLVAGPRLADAWPARPRQPAGPRPG